MKTKNLSKQFLTSWWSGEKTYLYNCMCH